MKGQTRNIDTNKLGPKGVNEFEFHKHQGEMHEHHDNNQDQGAAKVQTKAERVAEVTRLAHEKVLKRKKKR